LARRPGKNDNADKRDSTDESSAEAEHFARAMADVIPLAPDPRGRVRAAPPISTPLAAPGSRPSTEKSDTADGSDDSFVAPGVDRRELRKLKRGEHAPGSRLDLHGMTAAEAVARVKRFIDNGRHRNRSVCIVHGRGLHSEGNVSILKTRVRECLRHHRAVLAYTDAPRSDGGAGAVYVLLRK
jgi:DNA-nicking Smr family endonuclease